MLLSRRLFFSGVAATLAAPAIVRAESLMPVRRVVLVRPPWDKLILSLRADGVWEELDALYVFATALESDALANLRKVSFA